MAENRRVKITKRMLKEALLELLENRALEKITVTDVCANADVNRSTFYGYYQDIGQLLVEIEDDVLNQLPLSPGGPIAYSDQQFLATLQSFFQYVYENERLFRVLIVQRDSGSFSHRLVNSVMQKYKMPVKRENELLERYACVYCVNGVIGMMKEWIGGGFPISPKDFAREVLQISAKAMS